MKLFDEDTTLITSNGYKSTLIGECAGTPAIMFKIKLDSTCSISSAYNASSKKDIILTLTFHDFTGFFGLPLIIPADYYDGIGFYHHSRMDFPLLAEKLIR